jgi:hypothetical protein
MKMYKKPRCVEVVHSGVVVACFNVRVAERTALRAMRDANAYLKRHAKKATTQIRW